MQRTLQIKHKFEDFLKSFAFSLPNFIWFAFKITMRNNKTFFKQKLSLKITKKAIKLQYSQNSQQFLKNFRVLLEKYN